MGGIQTWLLMALIGILGKPSLVALINLNHLFDSKVGMGNSIRFWEDIWVGDSTLASLYPRLYRISHNTNTLIASIICWNSLDSYLWDLEFRRNLNGREFGKFLDLLDLVSHSHVSC